MQRNSNPTTPTQPQRTQKPKTGSYQPINRPWQSSHPAISDAKLDDPSPMARWEKETSRDQPWHAIQEVFVESGANYQSTSIEDKEKGYKSDHAVGGNSNSSYTYVDHGMPFLETYPISIQD